MPPRIQQPLSPLHQVEDDPETSRSDEDSIEPSSCAADEVGTAAGSGQPAVFYDGACPLCAREIAFYKNRKGADDVTWVDVSRCPTDTVAPGLSRKQALARLHALDAKGRLVSGGAAFSTLWLALPAFRPLARLFQLPPLAWILDGAYVLFLRIRPFIQARLPSRQDGAAA